MLKVHVQGDAEFTQEETVRAPRGHERMWVEVVGPSAEETAALATTLGLHELAIEDALRVGHPPKLEDFDDHLFLIAHTPDADAEEQTRKIAIFIAKNWVVTFLRAPLERVDAIRSRILRDPKRYLSSPALVAHALIDAMSDGFERQVEDLTDRCETLQADALTDPAPQLMGTILEVRQEATQLTRIVRSQRDVCQALARSEHAALPKKLRPYLRDVYDHVLRVHDLLEGVRDGLGAARDAYLSSINNRLSEVMRVLTVIATIMMPLSLLAGIYGMNFDVLPGQHQPLGFWILMGAMVLVGASMFLWFRFRRWL